MCRTWGRDRRIQQWIALQEDWHGLPQKLRHRIFFYIYNYMASVQQCNEEIAILQRCMASPAQQGVFPASRFTQVAGSATGLRGISISKPRPARYLNGRVRFDPHVTKLSRTNGRCFKLRGILGESGRILSRTETVNVPRWIFPIQHQHHNELLCTSSQDT